MTWTRVIPVLLIAVAAWYAWRRDFGWALFFTGIALGSIAPSWVGASGGLLCMIAGLILIIRRRRGQTRPSTY